VVRRSTARLLRQAGHEIVEARDGREAVQVYMRLDERPDVVLLDLDMPAMAGDEVHRALRAIDRTVRVVFVTGHGDEVRERAALAEGATAFLRKPCDAKDLLDAVGAALAEAAAPVS
jgi:CheY-like chemotaxis protein